MPRLLLFLLAAACASPAPAPAPEAAAPAAGRNEVIVLGMIHGRHRSSSAYGLDVVKDILRRIDPDVVLVEIPPDRFERAAAEFRATGAITEPRVRVFPEYTHALFPLTREMDFEIVPCAAWTAAMANDRKTKLERFKTERADDYGEMIAARREMNRRLERAGLDANPRGIHTARYDAIVERGMEPYARLFNDALGPGGWDNINAAHWRLIERALDARRGRSQRIVITFGAWHKHRILRELARRDDVVVRPLTDFWN